MPIRAICCMSLLVVGLDSSFRSSRGRAYCGAAAITEKTAPWSSLTMAIRP